MEVHTWEMIEKIQNHTFLDLFEPDLLWEIAKSSLTMFYVVKRASERFMVSLCPISLCKKHDAVTLRWLLRQPTKSLWPNHFKVTHRMTII